MSDLEHLPDTLEYTGEFGPELILFLPYVRWLARNGRLAGRSVRTYAGMSPFYEGLGIDSYEEKVAKREWVPPEQRPQWLPRRDEHTFDGLGRPPEHDYGDMRSQFAQAPVSERIVAATKPILVVHNKFNNEWDRGPINFFSPQTLERVFARLKSTFTIVYINHDGSRRLEGFSDDHNAGEAGLRDAAVLSRHPEVIDFNRDFEAQRDAGGEQLINRYKMAIYARCWHFLTVQGGGAAQIATMRGSLIVVLHRWGREEDWAYRPGYYGFLADPSPTLLTCASQGDVLRTIGAIARSQLRNDRVDLDPRDGGLLSSLHPRSISARTRWIKLKIKARARVRRLIPLSRAELDARLYEAGRPTCAVKGCRGKGGYRWPKYFRGASFCAAHVDAKQREVLALKGFDDDGPAEVFSPELGRAIMQTLEDLTRKREADAVRTVDLRS